MMFGTIHGITDHTITDLGIPDGMEVGTADGIPVGIARGTAADGDGDITTTITITDITTTVTEEVQATTAAMEEVLLILEADILRAAAEHMTAMEADTLPQQEEIRQEQIIVEEFHQEEHPQTEEELHQEQLTAEEFLQEGITTILLQEELAHVLLLQLVKMVL